MKKIFKDFFNFKKNIKEIWNGERSLVYSFWILYVVYIPVLVGIIFFFLEMLEVESSIFEILFLIIIILYVFTFIYSVIVSIGILKSASKYVIMKKKTNLSPIWGKLAQLVVFLGIINSVIVLFKLVKNF